MTIAKWWHHLKEMQETVENMSSISANFSSLLNSFQPIFNFPQAPTGVLEESSMNEISAIIQKLEELIVQIEKKEISDTHPQNKVIYELYVKVVEHFLQQVNVFKQSIKPESNVCYPAVPATPIQKTKAIVPQKEHLPSPVPLVEDTPPYNTFEETNVLAEKLFILHQEYSAIMEDRKQNAKTYQSIKNKTADELDRLNCFMGVVDYWMGIRFAFENLINILSENIENTDLYVEKKPLPLQFRIEKSPHAGTYRFIKASPKTSTENDQTVFDILDETLKLKILKRSNHILIDHSDIIRFVRLHSVANNLLQFKEDTLSKIASNMYDLFSSMAAGLRTLNKKTITLLNQTPMNELEYAFFGVNPEDCKILLRYKFQSLLPGLNEDHYYIQTEGKKRVRKERTRDIMDGYRKKFIESSEEILSHVKSTVAMSFWIRKLLTIVLKQEKLKKVDKEKPPQTPYLDVGISNTIGDEDIMNFYINPDDIISSEGVLQRADRADKWLMVNKSEKLHRIPKKDFFSILNTFVQNDLNVALKKFGLEPINFKDHLIPEIEERLSDIDRIDIIRSGILGTGITTLDDYCNNTIFHKTFNTYFNEKKSGFSNYPYKEKIRSIAEGLVQSKTAILQMKYRKILLVQSELLGRIKNLKAALNRSEPSQAIEIKRQYQLNRKLNHILDRIKMIMELAKPSLKQVRLETEDMVLKS